MTQPKFKSLHIFRSWNGEITGNLEVDFPSGTTRLNLTEEQASRLLIAAQDAIVGSAREASAMLLQEAETMLASKAPTALIEEANAA